MTWVLAALVAAAIAMAYRPVTRTWRAMTTYRPPSPLAGIADDASRSEATPVVEVVEVSGDDAAAEQQMVDLVRRASREGLRVSIAGARHSMGGHTISRAGVVLDLARFHRVTVDPDRRLLKVQGGARWRDVIPLVDRAGLSIEVMQSDADFSVGGSLSVNCHGWQHDRPPIAGTVASIRLLGSDGEIRRLAPGDEAFALALGGYGLFGVILDAEIRLIPNATYTIARELVPAGACVAAWRRLTGPDSGASMAYARLSVDPADLLGEIIITSMHPVPGAVPEPYRAPEVDALERGVFRAQVGDADAKRLRWFSERSTTGWYGATTATRNTLLGGRVDQYQGSLPGWTDILHEYFVPVAEAQAFIAAMRSLIARHEGDLLNCTMRGVDTDRITVLRYADQPMLAFVLYFNQCANQRGEAAMRALTTELVDAALAAGGRYYLPYRPHPTRDQFHRAYPEAAAFIAAKARLDPTLVFHNTFWDNYCR